MTAAKESRIHYALAGYIIFVFVQSLFYKFTGSPETHYIFVEKLDPWAASFGFPGLFAPGGIFSATVVGSAELVASTVLAIGTLSMARVLQGLGAMLAMAVISGAIFFHLFTPLGVSVKNADGSFDGGQLFALACGVWVTSAVLIWIRRESLLALVRR